MHHAILTYAVVLLSVLECVAIAAATEPRYPAAQLEVRQVSATPSQADLCLDYERTANMSTVGANGSYRTVVMQKSSVGTMLSARMMDAAIAKRPALTADQMLNTVCGNWTEIALKEAAANYTRGVVAQFTTAGLPVGIKAGPEVIAIVLSICTLFSFVWIAPS